MIQAPPDFTHIDAWVFDLDNTLYPPSCNLFAQIDVKMRAFISELLQVDGDEAYRLQKQYYRDHGTTLSGLMKLHGIAPHDFLSFVHDIDVSVVPPNEALADAPHVHFRTDDLAQFLTTIRLKAAP